MNAPRLPSDWPGTVAGRQVPAFLLLMGLGLPAALAADISKGQALHDKHCTSCHVEQYGGDGAQMYLRTNRLIQSRPALDKRVAFCNKMVKAGLSPSDEKEISAYLAERYYKFAP